jgi:modulator of FtsH protease HflC
MKNKLIFLLALIVATFLVAYMFTFQVRYDEVAVLTTWGESVEPTRDAEGNIDPDNAGSLVLEPGIYFKGPSPIQKVRHYSRKVQLLDDQLTEFQTADQQTIVVKFYLAWRIEDPYTFYREVVTVGKAKEQLASMFSELKAVVSTYRFDQLVNIDPEKVKLEEIEQKSLEQLRAKLSAMNPGYGIRVEQVGIRRIILPESTTGKVFERMSKTRELLAQQARSEGESQAKSITSQAESAKRRILAFAERRAQSIRDEGNREAEQYFSAFREDEDFAIFQRQIEALEKMLEHNTTFVMDANKLWFLGPLDDKGAKAN